MKFYKGAPNTRHPHRIVLVRDRAAAGDGDVRQRDRERLADRLTFSTPVAITAGTTYIASYHTSTGHYAVDINQFQATGVNSGPLHVPVGGGMYKYGTGGWPSTAANHNYWVDIVFTAN